ncbi:MAG: restriction endonuclease subunit S [Chloroflexota bacterium]|nr:MAG: restriction endonuclease subunit S [Chloroflexota bacterium]
MARTEKINACELRMGTARLDGSFYCSDGERTRRLLETYGLHTDTLEKITASITNEGRGRRIYVKDRSSGVQFLSSSHILLAEFDAAPYVSRRTPNLSQMILQEGWTLVSCSGTVGNVAFAHADFEGKAASQHVMRVAPNERIRSGYLFAWLSSKAGVALLKRGTYGSVIPTIEPPTVLDIPVARFADSIEETIHQRIKLAAVKRVKANQKLREARDQVYQETSLPRIEAPVGRNLAGLRTYTVSQSSLGTRFEGRYHDLVVRNMERAISNNSHCGSLPLFRCASTMFLPSRGKWADVSVGGLPLVGSGEMFSARPIASRHVSTTLSPGARELVVHQNDILVARSGQIYSILGDAILVGRSLAGKAVTEHAIRIRPDPFILHPGFLYAFLSLPDYGYGQIVRTAYGTSIPSLSVDEMKGIVVPLPEEGPRNAIGEEVLQAIDLRDQANDLEDEAQELLERALDEATGGAWSKLALQN